MRVWSLFHYRSYGAFFLQQNRLHNSYSGFTHYRNYRANKESFHLIIEVKGFFLEKDTKEKSKANWPYLVIGKEISMSLSV